jgi:hypothetical protein
VLLLLQVSKVVLAAAAGEHTSHSFEDWELSLQLLAD